MIFVFVVVVVLLRWILLAPLFVAAYLVVRIEANAGHLERRSSSIRLIATTFIVVLERLCGSRRQSSFMYYYFK